MPPGVNYWESLKRSLSTVDGKFIATVHTNALFLVALRILSSNADFAKFPKTAVVFMEHCASNG